MLDWSYWHQRLWGSHCVLWSRTKLLSTPLLFDLEIFFGKRFMHLDEIMTIYHVANHTRDSSVWMNTGLVAITPEHTLTSHSQWVIWIATSSMLFQLYTPLLAQITPPHSWAKASWKPCSWSWNLTITLFEMHFLTWDIVITSPRQISPILKSLFLPCMGCQNQWCSICLFQQKYVPKKPVLFHWGK